MRSISGWQALPALGDLEDLRQGVKGEGIKGPLVIPGWGDRTPAKEVGAPRPVLVWKYSDSGREMRPSSVP